MGTRWPLQSALDVVGGKWKLVAVMRVKDGTDRFGDLQRSLPGISRKQLAQCLRELVADGVLERVEGGANGRSIRYLITPLGALLQDSADALYRWGDAWLRRAQPPVGNDPANALVTIR